jgi:hypothetical protein
MGKLKAFALLGTLVAGLAATIGYSSDDAYEAQLKKRAHQIFEHDRLHQDLPKNRLYALSIALDFGNARDAETLVTSLEQRIRQN